MDKTYYIVGIVIIIVCALRGFRKGFVQALGNMGAGILSAGLIFFLKTWAFDSWFTNLLFDRDVLWSRIIICVVVYIAFFFLIKAILLSFGLLTRLPVLRGFNHMLGLLVGGAFGVVIVGVIGMVYSWFAQLP